MLFWERPTSTGLTQENAIIIGGAGMALHGLYTGVDIPPPTIDDPQREFDVDALLVPGTHIARRLRPFGDVVHFSDDESPLSLTLLRKHRVGVYAYAAYNAPNYPNVGLMLEERVVIDGLATLPIKRLVDAKLGSYGSGRHKDYTGIIAAHIAAWVMEEPAVNDPDWQASVRKVIGLIDLKRRDSAVKGFDFKLPRWLNTIMQNDFDHPALRDLRTGPSDKLSKAS